MEPVNFNDDPFNYESEALPAIVDELLVEIENKKEKTKSKRISKNYINNVDFCLALDKYKQDCVLAQQENRPKPKIPNYIGECFLKLSEGLARRPNFFGYSFRDEMVADGIENCLQYFENFDSEKTKNPFAYFTQIIWFCFVRRIKKEKTQQYIKYKSAEKIGILDDSDFEESVDISKNQFQVYDNMYDFIEKYEEIEDTKRKNTVIKNIKNQKIELSGVENFL